MARVFVYALVCFFLIQVGRCALPACTASESAGCPANATCTAVAQPCTCNAGFHEVGNFSCAPDIQIGGACTVKDVDTECVDNASCTNMAAEGAAEELKCLCKQGFHTKNPADGGASVCEADIHPGGVCTTKDADAECAEGATCMNVAPVGQAELLQCSCKPDFHEKTPVGESPVCEADIQPGDICTRNASADECQDGSTCVHASGQVSVLKCTCNAGSHTKTTAAGLLLCEPDIQPGGACTTVDNATECVANATCKSVTSEGVAASLQCTCDTGFSVMTNSTTNTSYCRAVMALGSPCTMSGSDVECDGNDTICMHMAREGQAPALMCTCKMGFHMTGTPPVCESDIAPGGPCTMTKDCVEGAQCQNVSAEGTAQSSQCTCMDKYHVTTVEGKAACEADVLPGQACIQENNSAECVTNAMCKNSQVAGQTAELKCMCNPNFHEAVDDAGSKICAEDTCQHTRNKCMAAGTTTCAEVNAFIGCMLDGVCNPDDAEQMAQFKAAMMEARAKLPADCAFSPSVSCTDKVTGCLSTYLKAENNCTNTEALGTCLTSAETTCMADTEVNNGYKLAKTFMQNATAALSCVCVKAASACLETETTNYGAENADKCKAARDLYTCALTTTACDLGRDIDNRALSVLWSQANTWAAANGCKDTLTEEAANTCALQLTRCAINYADGKQAAGDNKTASCMVTETFGSCLTDKTPQCLGADSGIKDVFTQQYALANSTCACINHLTMCYEAVGVLPTDAAVVCPKMATYSQCLLNAKCSLVTDHADMVGLKTAHGWYNQHKTAHNCQTTSDGECAQDTGVCADTLIMALSKEGVTATEKCSATADSVLCVNAANCSTAIAEDADMLSSVRDAATFRLQSLSCTEPTCRVTMQEFVACKDTYETAFAAAGTDNSQKCTSQNDMVKCLRRFKCNTHLEDLVQFKYDALKAVDVPNCNLLPLVEVTGVAAPSLRVTLPVLLVSLAVAIARI